MNVMDIKKHLGAVKSDEDRAIVVVTLDEFEQQVLSRLDRLEFGYLHGDFNDQNIIVESSDGKEYHFEGVVDFNEAVYEPKVFDLAIYMAYSMLGQFDGPQIDIPGYGLKGYLQIRRLSEDELNVLPVSVVSVEYSVIVLHYGHQVCVKARLCQSLVLGAHNYSLNPDNHYMLATAEKGWPALRALHNSKSSDIINRWLSA